MGREDIHALRWENASGKVGWSPAVKGGWKNARRPNREYLPFTDEVVATHLEGSTHMGLYPLLKGDACRLLVCDFDGAGWALDALVYLDAARAAGIPVGLERSRSGDGAHVWAFFSGPVAAAVARKVGAHLLREAMTTRAELDLASYDRLFPAQDFMPKGSFGNLIALPLQGECRKRETTVFLDPSTLEPFEDQWSFLSTLGRVSPKGMAEIAAAIPPIGAGPDEASYRRPSRSDSPKPPEKIMASAGAMISIERIGIPPALLSSIKHAASLHNPAYYEKERLRFSTWNTPRFVRSYGETLDRLLVPRGLRSQLETIVADAGSHLVVSDSCADPPTVEFRFTAALTADQATAFDALSRNDLGVLVAPPGSGKTVIACAVIAHHRVPSLVIVD
ncbi:MAG: TOTE conflict system archaeo-eukaryotic primase domain-containing protein, partial [Nitrososphaerales archaeon]